MIMIKVEEQIPLVVLPVPNNVFFFILNRPDIAYIQKDNVTLPALKHSVSNKAMERKKRSQILQKARLH